MLYLAIDQHRKQLTVNLRNPSGDVILKRQVSTQWERVWAFLEEVRQRSQPEGGFVTILEVCGFNDWLLKLLTPIPGTQYLIPGWLVCSPLLHRHLADFLDALVGPKGALPAGVVERLAVEPGRPSPPTPLPVGEGSHSLALYVAQCLNQRAAPATLISVSVSIITPQLACRQERYPAREDNSGESRSIWTRSTLQPVFWTSTTALRMADSRQSASRLNPMTGTPQHIPGVPSSQPASNSWSANSSLISVPAARITAKS
jgi:hypothetical protein